MRRALAGTGVRCGACITSRGFRYPICAAPFNGIFFTSSLWSGVFFFSGCEDGLWGWGARMGVICGGL